MVINTWGMCDKMTPVQERILEIYIEIKKLCEKHNITYFAIGGTCLGAVRHKGFIPWDDDMDIAIPIENFFEFQKIAKKELPEYLEIFSGIDIEHCMTKFIKVIDTRTTFIQKSDLEYSDKYKGVFVDIMPMSGIPSGKIAREIFLRKISFFSYINVNIRIPCKIRDILGKVLPYNYFLKKYYRILSKHPFDKSKYTGYTWSRYKRVKELTYPKEVFGTPVWLDFETTKIPCPANRDKYLSQQFGDYMKMPSESERRSGHNAVIVNLDKSYREYQKNGVNMK